VKRHVGLSKLGEARARLIILIRRVNCGHIRRVCLRDGDPIIIPKPDALLDTGSYDPKSEKVAIEDSILMLLFDKLRNAEVDIEVRNAVPYSVTIPLTSFAIISFAPGSAMEEVEDSEGTGPSSDGHRRVN